jgi:hypothetical protein
MRSLACGAHLVVYVENQPGSPREGAYLRKLFQVYQEPPEFFGLPKRVTETSMRTSRKPL